MDEKTIAHAAPPGLKECAEGGRAPTNIPLLRSFYGANIRIIGHISKTFDLLSFALQRFQFADEARKLPERHPHRGNIEILDGRA